MNILKMDFIFVNNCNISKAELAIIAQVSGIMIIKKLKTLWKFWNLLESKT